MRKLFFLVLAFTAGVLTLAWINSRPGRRSAPRRRRSGPGDTPRRERAQPPSTPSRATSAPPASSPEPRQCAGTTTSGKRCSREAREGSRFCWQHG